MSSKSCLYRVGQATRVWKWKYNSPTSQSSHYEPVRIEQHRVHGRLTIVHTFTNQVPTIFCLEKMCWTFHYHYGCCLCFCLTETSFCDQQNSPNHSAPLPMLVRLDKECEGCLKLSAEVKTSTAAIVARGRKRDRIIGELYAQRQQALWTTRSAKAQMQANKASQKTALKARKRAARRCVMRATKLLWNARAMLAKEDEV